MKIPNKKELQQIAFNYSSDINFQHFMNFYKKKCNRKAYPSLVIDTALASNNLILFQKESFRKNQKNNYDN